MFTRKQMMNNEISHHDYYAQFLDDEAIAYVVRSVGKSKIENSKDFYFNDVGMYLWDSTDMRYHVPREDWITCSVSTYNATTQANRPFLWSPSDNTCLAKTAARMYRERIGTPMTKEDSKYGEPY